MCIRIKVLSCIWRKKKKGKKKPHWRSTCDCGVLQNRQIFSNPCMNRLGTQPDVTQITRHTHTHTVCPWKKRKKKKTQVTVCVWAQWSRSNIRTLEINVLAGYTYTYTHKHTGTHVCVCDVTFDKAKRDSPGFSSMWKKSLLMKCHETLFSSITAKRLASLWTD